MAAFLNQQHRKSSPEVRWRTVVVYVDSALSMTQWFGNSFAWQIAVARKKNDDGRDEEKEGKSRVGGGKGRW